MVDPRWRSCALTCLTIWFGVPNYSTAARIFPKGKTHGSIAVSLTEVRDEASETKAELPAMHNAFIDEVTSGSDSASNAVSPASSVQVSEQASLHPSDFAEALDARSWGRLSAAPSDSINETGGNATTDLAHAEHVSDAAAITVLSNASATDNKVSLTGVSSMFQQAWQRLLDVALPHPVDTLGHAMPQASRYAAANGMVCTICIWIMGVVASTASRDAKAGMLHTASDTSVIYRDEVTERWTKLAHNQQEQLPMATLVFWAAIICTIASPPVSAKILSVAFPAYSVSRLAYMVCFMKQMQPWRTIVWACANLTVLIGALVGLHGAVALLY